MTTKRGKRFAMLLMLVGGPVGGWLINGDRGLLFGLGVGGLAIVWFLIEERKLL
jgi:hypothetical protein